MLLKLGSMENNYVIQLNICASVHIIFQELNSGAWVSMKLRKHGYTKFGETGMAAVIEIK